MLTPRDHVPITVSANPAASASTLRIVLVSPYSRGPSRGNITTVNRISRFLHQSGAEVLVLPADITSPEETADLAYRFVPDIIHAFHAQHCGAGAAGLAEHLQCPLVLTMTGSDIHDESLACHPATARALAGAAAVVCFSPADAGQVTGRFPGTAVRCIVIPQGVDDFTGAGQGNEMPDSSPYLLLPAALRPVKNIESAILATEGLTLDGRPVRLVLAGGIIDHDYTARIRELLTRAPWVQWCGECPRDTMAGLYRGAEIVLNCSHYEGMSNSIMEAMALGRTVLAADIPGNRALVRHGETGWLYPAMTGPRDLLLRLLGDRALRDATGARAHQYIRENHDPMEEARAYLHLYRSLQAVPASGRSLAGPGTLLP